MKEKDTGIPCFECNERLGVDCPGRKPDEATHCVPCMIRYLKEITKEVMLRRKDSLQKLSDKEENDGT